MYSYDYVLNFTEFNELDTKEMRAFKEWFLSSLEDRMERFVAFVRQRDGYGEWAGDYSEESLLSLSAWLYRKISGESHQN